MELIKKIQSDFIKALKEKDTSRLETLRLIKSAFHNYEIEKRKKGKDGELNDEEALNIVIKEAKKRREAKEMYESGGRNDLAEKEAEELEVLSVYLPAQADDKQIEGVIDNILGGFPNATQKDFGKIMGAVMKEMKGRADAKRVGELIRSKIG